MPRPAEGPFRDTSASTAKQAKKLKQSRTKGIPHVRTSGKACTPLTDQIDHLHIIQIMIYYCRSSSSSSPACRCERLCGICIVHIQPRKRSLHGSDCTVPNRQHEPDHTRLGTDDLSALIDLDHQVGIRDLAQVYKDAKKQKNATHIRART